ncbi:MAG TPA: 3-oxoacyl-[acyl-carrier-protein] synthase III C-terminal domain-containing protein [Acidimicrobiales bacterium]|nr:3-oxoacyl-[acyl-carrier-protein] synthase III C-terminal domain-containing protein [Acidimicrobiales bacterium]
MPTTIDGMAVVTGGWHTRRSARRLADAAGRAALQECGGGAPEVDLLVNAGLYHDRNMGEPALAPLIQEDIGANPSDPYPGGAGTFSFDVANGSAGVLSALQVVDGFVRAGTVATALIVASDADPGHGLAPGFPFSPAGGALVCRRRDGPGGVGRARWCNRPDGGDSFRTTVGMRSGRNVLVVDRVPGYADRLTDASSVAVAAVMEDEELAAGDVDVVLVSPGLPELVTGLAARTGIAADRFVAAAEGLHTVAPIAVFDAARRRNRIAPGTTVLLVAGGAGVTAGAVVYRA